jgi:hypothetical protein
MEVGTATHKRKGGDRTTFSALSNVHYYSYHPIIPAMNPKVQDGGLLMSWEYRCFLHTMHTVHIK